MEVILVMEFDGLGQGLTQGCEKQRTSGVSIGLTTIQVVVLITHDGGLHQGINAGEQWVNARLLLLMASHTRILMVGRMKLQTF